ncbi:MAG: DNA-directed RNA polymerase subunit delta [Lachnospiraceae bacterium]|nr:DNA-directed RNA polymerase subunit delta [Lachnospiraceae bacterium]
MKKIIKALAVIASICGICFLFKDSIKEALSAIKGKLSNDDFDDFDEDFDEDDFDEDKIFGKSSDREYVDITITDEDEDDAEAEDETAEESDETEE